MSKIWLIVKREYWTRVRKKSFLLLTLLAPLGLAILMVVPFLVTNIESDTKSVLLKDESGIFKDLRDTTGVDFSVTALDYTSDSLITLFSDLGFDALLYIPKNSIDQITGVQLWSKSQIGVPTQFMIESALEEYVAVLNLEKLGLNRNDIKIRPNINLQTSLTGTQDNKESSAIIATAIGYGMGFLIYMVLLIYGTMVMKGVMEEKTNRIVEVIITSVKPFQLMLGKILGIGAVGLTQFTLWIILASITQAIIAV
ncbi:MAG: ABC-2 type transport system permease protein, partial [Limisphaerales bacterium]